MKSLSILALMLFSAQALAHGDGMNEGPLVQKVLKANDRFKDVKVALAEGYTPIPCASGLTGGAMGIHYVNGELLKSGKVDVAHPQAIMYEPQAGGKLDLIAVEYIAFKGPAALEGHLFNFVSEPNRYGLDKFYEMHVWAWRDNPTGTFADMNPKVSCDAAEAP